MEELTATSVLQQLKELESSPEKLVELLKSIVSESSYAQLLPGLKDDYAHQFIDILDRVSLHDIHAPKILHASCRP
jgi:hypothetical protein